MLRRVQSPKRNVNPKNGACVSITAQYRAVAYPTRRTFRISRSAVNHVDVVQVTLQDGSAVGRGECRPYARYGDTVESVLAQLRAVADLPPVEALTALPAGPAKNALDCAALDLEAKRSGQSVWQLLELTAPRARETAFTISWNPVEQMIRDAQAAKQHTLLKLKIGDKGLAGVQAVAAARPDARLIVDANEALQPQELPAFLDGLTGLNIALIEQPLPAGHKVTLPLSNIPICADEGLHTQDDLEQLWEQGYRAVNVKLDKCGGLRAGVDLMRAAKTQGFIVMAGCMVGSSLAMAPMMVAESMCDVIDLDGPLLLADDITGGLKYDGAEVFPPTPEFWG
jgi:L-alanine-DL-glutamate epimerase-like enolase superfamily enzyme